jgi:hypothetical protein
MKQNRNKMLSGLTVLLLLGMVLCSFSSLAIVLAEEGVAKEDIYYIVREGDCLWTISDRFYEDPFLWPFVWRNNSFIANPHWIYPGERIFLAEVGKPVSRGMVRAPEGEGEPTREVKTLVIPRSMADTALLTETSIQPEGWVLESQDGRTLLTQSDELFLEMSNDPTIPVGEEFQILRRGRDVRHPKTGKKIGTLVRLMGIVKTTGPTKSGIVPARVIISNNAIEAGDMVTKGVMLPMGSFYSKTSSRDLKGTVVANLNDTKGITQYDVCFIDRGLADGVEVGDSFWVMNPGKKVRGYGKEGKITLPDTKVGKLVVLFTDKNSSTTLVTESDTAFPVGASVSSLVE